MLAGPEVWGGEEAAPAIPGLAVLARDEVRLRKADHHRRPGWTEPRLTGEPPARAIQQSMAFRINKKLVILESKLH